MKKISLKAVLTFIISISIFIIITIVSISNRQGVEVITMEQLVTEKSIKVNEVISKLIYKTHILSTFIVQTNGEGTEFEQIAEVIVDDPSIRNVLIAKDGIVTDVYPLEGRHNLEDGEKQVIASGHNVGDIALKEYSARVKKHLLAQDILARISGDEFIVAHIRGCC